MAYQLEDADNFQSAGGPCWKKKSSDNFSLKVFPTDWFKKSQQKIQRSHFLKCRWEPTIWAITLDKDAKH